MKIEKNISGLVKVSQVILCQHGPCIKTVNSALLSRLDVSIVQIDTYIISIMKFIGEHLEDDSLTG